MNRLTKIFLIILCVLVFVVSIEAVFYFYYKRKGLSSKELLRPEVSQFTITEISSEEKAINPNDLAGKKIKGQVLKFLSGGSIRIKTEEGKEILLTPPDLLVFSPRDKNQDSEKTEEELLNFLEGKENVEFEFFPGEMDIIY